MYSRARAFSHIYVEKGVSAHPRARRIIGRFKGSTIIEVDDYQNLFGRGRQDFWRQKASPKLILAAKKENLIYPGNAFLQAGMSPNFGYNALVLNCPYDCHYCYLQGMYASANIVAFVNLEDYFAAAGDWIRDRPDPSSPASLAISYDSDLLALEGILGYVREWADWARGRRDVCIEVRTKSTGSRLIGEVEPTASLRLAWTLSPQEICRSYEPGTPPLEARIKALNRAASLGWPVSVCVDPVLRVPGWETVYGKFAETLQAALPWDVVERVELGVFRISPGYFKRMRRRPDTDLLHYPYEHANNAVSYKEAERNELVNFLKERLTQTLSTDKIHIWT